MNDNNEKDREGQSDESLPTQSESGSGQAPRSKRNVIVASVGMVAIAAAAILAWFLWPKQSGKPVPAPLRAARAIGSSPGSRGTSPP